MATYGQTKDNPERKWLALFAAVACAACLRFDVGMSSPAWLEEYRILWQSAASLHAASEDTLATRDS